MAKQNRTTLKGYFETGDIPNQNQYADLIDSNLNLSENNTGNIQLTGEITASGNISASGNIEVSGLNSSGDISCGGNSSCNGSFSCDGNISSSADVISNNITATNITASGNISSSGTITAEHFVSSDDAVITDQLSVGGDIVMSKNGALQQNITFTQNPDSIYYDGSNIVINANDGDQFSVGNSLVTVQTALRVTGHITASANISASGGGFFGGDVQLDNNQALIGKKLNNVTMNLAKVNSSGLIFLGDSLTNTTYVEGQDIIIGKSSATSLTTVLNDFKVNGHISGSGNLKINGSQVDFTNLPTSDPSVAGRLWNDSGTLKISAG